ncbi:MAG TPA: NUDIX domain-containing protein [Ktedonobacterales bacterium]|jgi:8-oxo-dGTP diphosphatase
MAKLTVDVVVIDAGRVLLAQREDLHVWALPGGMIEPGETAAEAAIREVEEETGIRVELLALVGLYARPEWIGDDHCAIFAARPLGGVLKPQDGEAVDVAYFAADALPERLVWWHRQPIADALAGRGGSAVWRQEVRWPFGERLPIQRFLTLRAQGQLTTDLREMAWRDFCRLPSENEQRREAP